MHFKVKLQGIPVDAFGDSGSNRAVLWANHWEDLKSECKRLGRVPKFVTRKKALTCANGTKLRILGYVHLKVTNLNGKSTRAEFEIAEGSSKARPILSESILLQLGLMSYSPEGASVACVDHPAYVDSVFGLEDHEMAKIAELNKKYSDVFKGIGKYKGDPVHITVTEDFKQILVPARNIPLHYQEPAVKAIKSLLDDGILEVIPEGEPILFCSPVHVVKKPSKPGEPVSVRITVDHSRMNQFLRRERHVQAWRFEDFSHRLEQMPYKIKLDMCSMYFQFPIDEESRRYMCVSTPIGTLRLTRLSMGLLHSQDICDDILQQVLAPVGDQVFAYRDDIVCGAKSMPELLEVYEKVLKCLQGAGLTLNEKKCQYGTEIKFFGRVFGKDFIAPDHERVRVIVESERPKTKKGLHSFISMVAWDSQFIHKFAGHAEVLRDMVTQPGPLVWTESADKAFETLKMELAKEVRLNYFKLGRPCRLYVDAGRKAHNQVEGEPHRGGLAAVLLQADDNNNWKPIHFVSRRVTKEEANYGQTELEMRAIRWACDRLRYYLCGAEEFEIYTDAKALVPMFGPRRRNRPPRIERDAIYLSDLSFRMKYVKGEHNMADWPSRMPLKEPSIDEVLCLEDDEGFVRLLLKETVERFSDEAGLDRVRLATSEDDELSFVIARIQGGDWHAHKKNVLLKSYYSNREELSMIDGVVYFQDRIVLPTALRKQFVETVHRHGHQGRERTRVLAEASHWFPGLRAMVTDVVMRCDSCARHVRAKRKDPQTPIPVPRSVGMGIATDFKGPLEATGGHLLVFLDRLSHWPEVYFVKSTKFDRIKWALDDYFCRWGDSYECLSDGGPPYNSAQWAAYLRSRGIRHVPTTPTSPRSNGECEAFMKVLNKAIHTAKVTGADLRETVNKTLQAYRGTTHPVLGVSPFEVEFNGRKMRIGALDPRTVEMLNEHHIHDAKEVRRRLEKEKEGRCAKENAKRYVKKHEFVVGDIVLVDPNGKGYDKDLYIITRVLENSIMARTLEEPIRRVHRQPEKFKKYYGPRQRQQLEVRRDRQREVASEAVGEEDAAGVGDAGEDAAGGGAAGGGNVGNEELAAPRGVNRRVHFDEAALARRDAERGRQEPQALPRPQPRPATRSQGPAAVIPNVLAADPMRSHRQRAILRDAHRQLEQEIQRRRDEQLRRHQERGRDRDRQQNADREIPMEDEDEFVDAEENVLPDDDIVMDEN